MMIQLEPEQQKKLHEICDKLGREEILGQMCEECGELIQAAQKVRRAMKGTTPVSIEEAMVNLAEECADVALIIDCLVLLGIIDEVGIQFIGRYKTGRWHGRIFDEQIRAIVGPENFVPWEERYN